MLLSRALATAAAASVPLALSSIRLSPLHRYVARVLTDWENHRTESEYEKSYIIKSFSFQAVNS